LVRELCVYARWPPGGLKVCARGETLTIEAKNMFLSFEPRLVLVDGGYSGYSEACDDRKCRLVIEFGRVLEPLEAPRIEFVGQGYIGLFELRVVDLEFEKYITVITPGGFLYDYFTVTSSRLLLESSAKRRFYYEEEPYSKLIVHIM